MALLLIALCLISSCGKQETETPTPTPQQPTTYTISISAGDEGKITGERGRVQQWPPGAEYVFTGWSNGSTENQSLSQ